MTYHDGEAPREVELFSPETTQGNFLTAKDEMRKHSIEDILGRPVLVKQGSWGLTDATGAILYSFDSPGTLLASSLNAREKVRGFLDARYTTCVQVIINAQPTQQGRLVLAFAPAAAVARKAQLQTNLTTFTQRPRVDIDISVDTDVTFRIPYMSEYLATNFADNTGGLGYFDLFVYSPLLSPSGSNSVGYSVYMWLEDLDLQIPTYVAQGDFGHWGNRSLKVETPLPQCWCQEDGRSGSVLYLPPGPESETLAFIIKMMYGIRRVSPALHVLLLRSLEAQLCVFALSFKPGPGSPLSYPSDLTCRRFLECLKKEAQKKMASEGDIKKESMDGYEAQMAGPSVTRNTGDPTTKEAEDPGTGIVAKTTKAMKMLGKSVPSLMSAFGAPGWVEAAAKGAIQYWGFSKPISDHMTAKVAGGFFPHLNHSDGGTFAQNLGMFHKNQVQHLPGFAGQSVDELAFSYICCIPSYYQRVNWTTSAVAGTELWTTDLFPNRFQTTVGGWTYHTPMSYVQQTFQLWRGSLMFHFKVVKTKMHSGRLMVSWQPGGSLAFTADNNYLYRQIFDMREGTEFTFTVPYAATTPYKDYSESVGALRLSVLNPLVAPAIVSSSVEILVEVCAGKDIEFACPRVPDVIPISYASNQMEALRISQATEDMFEAEPIYEAQGDWGEVYTVHSTEISAIIQSLYGKVDLAEYEQIIKEFRLVRSPDANHLESTVLLLSVHYDLGGCNVGWGDSLTYNHNSKEFTVEYTLEEWVTQFIKTHKISLRSAAREIAISQVQAKRSKSLSPKRSKSRSPPKSPNLSREKTPEIVYEAQGLMDTCEQGNTATVNMLDDPVNPSSESFDVSNSAFCIGESIPSWRVYIKRLMPWKILPILATGQTWKFRHLMFHQPTTTGNTLVQQDAAVDALNWVAPCYAFWRGSVRYAFYVNSTNSTNVFLRVGLDTPKQMGTSSFVTVAAADYLRWYVNQTDIVPVSMSTAGGLEVQIPFYCKRTTGVVNVQTPGTPIFGGGNPDLSVSVRLPNASEGCVFRAAADDFDLGFFLGCPITMPTFTVAPVQTSAYW